MAVPKAKKSAKQKRGVDKLSANEIIQLTNYLTLSVALQTLYGIQDYTKEQAEEFVEGYVALMQEIADRRITVPKQISACKEITGFDVKKIVDEIYKERNK